MIGQAGTGSPEAGIVLRVDPRVLVYTLRTGDETRRPGGPEQSRESSPQHLPAVLLLYGRQASFSSPGVGLCLV